MQPVQGTLDDPSEEDPPISISVLMIVQDGSDLPFGCLDSGEGSRDGSEDSLLSYFLMWSLGGYYRNLSTSGKKNG
jgi:hypothetical protein